MASFRKLSLLLALFLTVIIILIIPVTSQPQPQPQACESYKFPNNTNFLACNDLPVLDSSLHWTYHPSSNSIDVAFKKNNANYKRWIAWAINPTSTGMVGSQAFVAFLSASRESKVGESCLARRSCFDDDSLRSHALSGANFKSFGRIDFLTGKVSDRDALTQNSKILIRKRESSLGYCDYIVLTLK
ncbi:hypothetical protein K1719_044728 [Acacia pycnantha]|nr:hypothetical protein K1719_044728 [Acacia pycnantha]